MKIPRSVPRGTLLSISICQSRSIKNSQMFPAEHLWKSISNLVSPSLISIECPSDYPALKSGIAIAQSMGIFCVHLWVSP